ncbi:MAG TPA: site-specific integrase [Rhizomicrobium sp.]|jgi:site-specific recombinase XerD
MKNSLFDRTGKRKYLVARERLAFVRAACGEDSEVGAFCLTLAITGARISEVLALTMDRIDSANRAIVFETLKQRERGIFRAVPAPSSLIRRLTQIRRAPRARIWPWGRTYAWKSVKQVMRKAGIADWLCKPKALRHGFAVEAGQKLVPLNIIQRWLGHARLETTAIYMNALGVEERNLARRVWGAVQEAISRSDTRTP